MPFYDAHKKHHNINNNNTTIIIKQLHKTKTKTKTKRMHRCLKKRHIYFHVCICKLFYVNIHQLIEKNKQKHNFIVHIVHTYLHFFFELCLCFIMLCACVLVLFAYLNFE